MSVWNSEAEFRGTSQNNIHKGTAFLHILNSQRTMPWNQESQPVNTNLPLIWGAFFLLYNYWKLKWNCTYHQKNCENDNNFIRKAAYTICDTYIGMVNPVDSVALIQKKHEYSSSQKINICGNTLWNNRTTPPCHGVTRKNKAISKQTCPAMWTPLRHCEKHKDLPDQYTSTYVMTSQHLPYVFLYKYHHS